MEILMLKKIFSTLICTVLMFALAGCGSGSSNSDEPVDYITGNKWENSDGMLLSMSDDNSFKWYKSSSDRKDNYYSGTYSIIAGQDAIDYLSENYSFDEDGQKSTLAKFSVSLEEYYVIIMNNEERIASGENTLEEPTTSIYYGYYQPDYESLTIYNIDTLYEYVFTKK
jgi:hypothetical protein